MAVGFVLNAILCTIGKKRLGDELASMNNYAKIVKKPLTKLNKCVILITVKE